jgi:chromosome partitioning protein
MVERSAFKAPFSLGGTIYGLTQKEASNPQAAIDNAETFAQEVRDTLVAAAATAKEVSSHARA